MAKLYDKGNAASAGLPDPEVTLAAIRDFLGSCRTPAVIEEGEELVRLVPGQFALEVRGGRLWFEWWDEQRSVSRRILSVQNHAPAVLDCTVHRFGGTTGKLSFLDVDRPQSTHRSLTGSRRSFAEQFRRMLYRQFPGWQIRALSCGMHLQQSFSPVFPRAVLTRGTHQIAAMACPVAADEPALLTFALIWLDHVRTMALTGTGCSLCLFLPDDAGVLTSHRLRWLHSELLSARMFRFNAHGSAGEIDPHDLGNIETRVTSHYAPAEISSEAAGLLSSLSTLEGVGACPEIDGSLSIRCRGIEFARVERGRMLLGLRERQEVTAAHLDDVQQFAAQLSQLQHSGASFSSAAQPGGCMPERWLEQSVRAALPALDASLLAAPVHGQVLTFAGLDRDLIDLLAVSSSGRLAIIELKASEDIHLPIQALDYWIRIVWHAERNQLQHLFPGIPLASTLPKVLLVAPALCFHSSTARILRFFSPQIEVERIGINSDWHARLKVVMRLQGANVPISHEVFDESRRFNEH